ncbi:helix-turn-helix domain-containing protein [Rhodococcus sp. ACPA4]|uniref:helix-turn-helix domain-containing protein n=1 Tax=Rhodococcus sp. ACPA4 TaxID=2028571 RepID=UPI001C5273F2
MHDHRLRRPHRDLADPSSTVQAISTRWGFADASRLCRVFKAQYGVTPSEYRLSRT